MKQAFNRSLINNYSWLPKGINSSILNINAKGRWSMITAVWWDGEFIVQIFNSTINSQLFQQFLCVLNYALKYEIKNCIQNVIICMDNAAIHTSKSTIKVLSNMKHKTNFFPPYWPHLAPVELFFKLIKSKIRSNYSKIQLDFSGTSGRDWICKVWSAITTQAVKKIWICFIKQAKKWILNH